MTGLWAASCPLLTRSRFWPCAVLYLTRAPVRQEGTNPPRPCAHLQSMARSRTLLLPALLLLLLLAAAADQPGDAAVEAPTLCPALESVATGVALFCAGRLPTEPCCQALAQAGAACLCSLASSPPLVAAALNATELLRLYAGCAQGASSVVCDGGEAAGASTSSSDRNSPGPCMPETLADQMGLFCAGGKAPTANCCEAVVAAVGMGAGDAPCFCGAVRASGIGFPRVVGIYAACGGLRRGLAADLVKSCARIPNA
ncbi:hypothetical protein QOZ80_3AG0222330 [Eleusine coracana subsp. coracana]|nr:hypothetical protein QOZ80_3AG0222330 [Eleusine coracana subsp. coracana]